MLLDGKNIVNRFKKCLAGFFNESMKHSEVSDYAR